MSSNCGLECADYSTGGATHTGVRWVLLGINSFLLIAGVAMITLGIKLTESIDAVPSTHDQPDIWWLGMTPLTTGFIGVICTVLGHRKLLLSWAVYNTLTAAGSYIYFVRKGFFNHATFGVTMRIYGVCKQTGHTCVCILPSHAISISSQQSCDNIRYVTSIYLTQMIFMTSVLAASIIGCFLAFIASCCHKCCILNREEDQPLLVSAVQSTPSLYRSQQTTTYMTDLMPKRKLRTYLSRSKHNTNTMV